MVLAPSYTFYIKATAIKCLKTVNSIKKETNPIYNYINIYINYT